MSNNALTSNNQASRAPPRDEVAFNANEIRELLKQGLFAVWRIQVETQHLAGFQSVSSEEEKSGSYKNASQSNSIKSAGAWSKGNYFYV